nr:MAG TPA: terminase large subunit [Caudoviricetes sp.]
MKVKTMKTARELWQYISKNGLKPLPKTSVSNWADDHRMLSSGISAEPGKWKTSRAPYQKDIMNAFTEPGIHRVVVKSSSQIGKSDMMNNVIGRFAHLDPCAIMMIQPTIDMAQDYSKTRIAPMIRDTKVLNNLFYDVKSRDANNTILSKVFPGGRLIMCGANSPAGLASRPIRILLADEVDRFPDSAGTEGDPVDLAAKRMTTFWNSCMGLFSTPTNEGTSRIDEEYLAGTQEEWQHKCPNCGEYHLLRHIDMTVDYKEIKTPSGKKTVIVNDVKWRCPHCGFSFSEKEMKQTQQKYISQNSDALKNGIRSFFVNGFTSPWMTWTKIMREWLEAKGDPEREKVIMNTVFGESYKQKGAFEDEQIFLRRRESYGAELPDGVLLLTAAIDTQDNRLEYEVVGWGKEEECWGIRKGIVLGAPNQARTWKEIDNILDKTYHFADGKGLKVVRTFIDSGGHYTSDVYNYCQKNFHKQRFAIKGRGGPGIPLIYKIAKANNAKAPLILLGVDDGKQQIMDRLSIDSPGPLYFHFPQDEGIKELSNRGYDDLYFKGIISEHKKVYKRNGVLREVWETTKNVRNEPLDLRNYNLACMKSLKPDWVKLEMLVNGMSETEVKRAVAKPQKKKAVYRAKRQVNIW